MSSVERRSAQAPGAVIMIRPHHFSPNKETAKDNAFQKTGEEFSQYDITQSAYQEASAAAKKLESVGVKVHIFEDEGTETPDSVFPNNWFSTHPGGHVAVYPMFAENRRLERRYDVIEMLKQEYRVQDIIDYSGLEPDGLFLEGTGAMVLDHIERVAYAIKSNRTDPVALERFCTHFNYEPMVFDALDEGGTPIYHTNVMMCLGDTFAVICLSSIDDKKERKQVVKHLKEDGKAIIDITEEQVNNFAGNMLQVKGVNDERYLIMSQSAYDCLTESQINVLEKHTNILSSSLETIETCGGGSARCMMAEVFLPKQ